MRNGACKAIELPDDYTVKSPSVRVGHKPIELWALFLRSRDTDIHVFSGDGPAAALAVLAEFTRLHRNVLSVVRRADPRVDRCLHIYPRFYDSENPARPRRAALLNSVSKRRVVPSQASAFPRRTR